MEDLDILILGAGWSSTFLIPLLISRKANFAATTTTGRPVADHPTIKFKFDPSDPNIKTTIAALPRARHIIITFPLTGTGPSKLLTSTYETTHLRHPSTFTRLTTFRFIQLGSTGVWQDPNSLNTTSVWKTRHSPITSPSPRSEAEDELLSLGGCVLHLAGLWDGTKRIPSNWIPRVGKTKDDVRKKESLHMIHGVDVARAIYAMTRCDESKWGRECDGQRWMLTDMFVYDWWALFAGWAGEVKDGEGVKSEWDEEGGESKGEVTVQAKWVGELMVEEKVRALPRPFEMLKRCYDTREFWSTFDLVPLKGRMM